MNEHKPTHPGLAAVFSFIFNGLGQLYNGQILKGLIIIFLSSLSMLLLIIGSVLMGYYFLDKFIFLNQLPLGLGLFFIGLVCICILGIYSILDAYKVAAASSK